MKFKLILIFSLIISLTTSQQAQVEIPYSTAHKPHWVKLMYAKNPDPGAVTKAYEEYYRTHPFVKNTDTQYYKRWLRSISRTLIDENLPESEKIKLRQEQNDFIRKTKSNRSTSRGPGSTWSCIGPFDWDHDAANRSYAPGAAHVYTVEQSQSNPDVLYAGTATAGVWKTTDRGLNWECVTKDMFSGNVTALEIDNTDENIIYIESNSGIWKSTDGGTSWTETGDAAFKAINHNIADIVSHPVYHNTVFAATTKGLFKTTDGGDNWENKFEGDIQEIELHPTHPDTMYMTLRKADHTEFYRSTDRGDTWEAKMNGWPAISSFTKTTFPSLQTDAATSDYVEFDTNPEPGEGSYKKFTIEMRIKCSDWSSDPAILSNKNWSSGSNKGFIIHAGSNSSNWKFNMGDGSSRIDLNGGDIRDNVWHHIAVVYDSSGLKKLYQDGDSLSSSSTILTGSVASGLSMALGQDGTLGYGASIQFEVSDIRFWDTILTTQEIQEWQCKRVDNTHPHYANLVHYWKIDEGNGTTLNDDISTNDGTVINNYSWVADNEMNCIVVDLEEDEHQRRTEIAVSADSVDKVFALAPGVVNGGEGLYGVYVSSDLGETWTFNCCGPQPGGPSSTTNKNLMAWAKDGSQDGGQYYYDVAFDVSPTHADSVFAAGVNLWISDDGGNDFVCPSAWSEPGLPSYVHADIHDIHYYKNTKEIWLSCDGGIFYSNDGGANFERRMHGISGTDFWGFGAGYWDGEVMLGGAYHNGTLLKDNDVYLNGWLCTDGGDGTRGYVNQGREKFVFSDYNRKLLSGDRTIPYKTFSFDKKPNADYTIGKTFRLLFHPNYYDTWYTGSGTVLYRTENNGESYDTIHDFGADVVASALSFSDPNYIYVTTFPGWWDTKRIYRTSDAGKTWTEITPSSAIINGSTWIPYDITIDPEDPLKVWIVRTSMYGGTTLNGYAVYFSDDGGATWQNKTTSDLDGETFTNIVYQKGTNGGVNIGTRRAVYYRNNSMSNWALFNNGLPVSASTTRLVPYYREGKLRNATNQSVWEVDFYENSTPIAMPSVDRYLASCVNDTLYFKDHSVLNQKGATWSWSFPGGTPSTSSSRTPKVTYTLPGKYDVTLTVTDNYGTSTKTIQNMVEVGTACDPDKIPGKALSLSGSPDYCIINDFDIKTDTLTITAWVKPNGIQPDYSAIFMNEGTVAGLNFREGNNTLGYHWPGGAWYWDSNLIVPQDKWSYVAMVATPDSMTLYVNEKRAVHVTSLDEVQFQTSLIGSFLGWSSRNFNGEIDELAIWQRALTQDEIRELRHLTKDPSAFPNLKGYYQFNNDLPSIPDKTGNYPASYHGNATLVSSSAPVGYGKSQRKSITSGGAEIFDQVGMTIGFPSSGTYPDGEIVVSRLEVLPNVLPDTNTPLPNGYWIINNYGSNTSFSGLDSLRFFDFFVSEEMKNLADTTYELFKRTDNQHLNNWTSVSDNNTELTKGINGSITFKSTTGITSSGQFIISRDSFVRDTPDVTISSIQNANLMTEGGASIALRILADGQGIKFPVLTASEIENIKSPIAGMILYNDDIDSLCYFDGVQWNAMHQRFNSDLNPANPTPQNTVSLGTVSDPSAALFLPDHQGGIRINAINDNDIPNIKYPLKSMIMYRSDINKMCFFDGTNWRSFKADPLTLSIDNTPATTNIEGISVGGGSKDPNAVLDIRNADKVMTIPHQNILDIKSPVKGLVIYNANKNSLMMFDGTSWQTLLLDY